MALLSDDAPQKTFFTSRDLVSTGVAAAVTVGIMQFDKKIARWTQTPSVHGSSTRANAVNSLTKINETPLGIASVLTYGIGRLTGSKTTADVGLHWAEALFMTDVISEAIRGPIGRARPRVSPDDPFNFKFWGGFTDFDRRAFPSLHSAVGFATAAALLGEIRERHPSATWYAGPLLYTFAVIPGATRMYLNQHWASDVFAGAFVGQLIGSRVVHYAHTHKRTKLDRALLATSVMPDGYGGTRVTVSLNDLLPAGW
ncbi:MAG TPA: phosphatase PAP2 family protein [Acidimicrobiia bacterium]|nr:phosphatase PAP2 family protein [Acidimicrobiia bacterium]